MKVQQMFEDDCSSDKNGKLKRLEGIGNVLILYVLYMFPGPEPKERKLSMSMQWMDQLFCQEHLILGRPLAVT